MNALKSNAENVRMRKVILNEDDRKKVQRKWRRRPYKDKKKLE
jgi:hypothetical protein